VNVARVDTVDAELDWLISKRTSQDPRPDPDEQEELWKESVRRYKAPRREEMRTAWAAFHEEQAERHQVVLTSLVERHKAEAERYRNMRLDLIHESEGAA
jgi:hypothetical protein